jgi:nicotinate-nucleotide adenylyltransferase
LVNLINKNYPRVGILGGSFDPPHLGHLHISKIALKKLKLNKLIWIVTKQNPLKKKPFLDIKKRMKLSEHITNKQKKISVKYLKSPNTFDVLYYLKRKNIKINLFFLMGEDNLIQFHKWKNWKKISQLAKIVVFARTGYSGKALSSVAAKKLKKKDWVHINSKKMNISSSLIKKFW